MNLVTTKLKSTLSFEEAAATIVLLSAGFAQSTTDSATPKMSLTYTKNEDGTVAVETMVIFDLDDKMGKALYESFEAEAQANADNGYQVTIEAAGETRVYSSLIAN